ncbi:MAG: flagellar biosynthesis anti-sigma factor FlgM [Tepidiformaceae bacterium]
MSDVRKATSTESSRGVVYDFARARQRVAAAPTAEPASEADKAGITDGARELGHARVVVEAAPDVRADRIQALRKQIADGTYQPDPREIAREIMGRGI